MMTVRNEIKAQIVRAGYTMQEVVDRLHEEYGWSDSVSNLSAKLQRESIRYKEVVELADVLGYDETGGLPLFSPEGRTYSPPRRGSGTCRWQAVRSPRGIAAAAAASRQCHSTYGRCCHRLCRRQIPCDKRRELGQKFSTLCCRLPAQTCHRQLCRRDGRAFCPPIFSLRKRNRKKKRGERAMAIYHLEAKVVSRGAGRSAVAASAYLSCSRLYNDYDGIQHDYTKKQGLLWQQVFLPEYAL